MKNIFGVDFSDLNEVKKLANRMGPGQTVIRHEGNKHFNIIHTANEAVRARKGRFDIIYRTVDGSNQNESST